jgi:hypothetical protein
MTNLSSNSNGNRRIFTFSPPSAPTAPSALNFTGVSQTGMTLNWTDNSSNEIGFSIFRSSDGINYTLIATVGAGIQTYAASGLLPGQTYYWNVYAYGEGATSNALSGSQATNAAGSISSTLAGGNWSATTTWAGGVVPGAGDVVTIIDGSTVIIDAAANCNNLTVGQGTSGVLRFGTTATSLTVNQSVTVAVGGTFDAGAAGGASLTHTLNIGGNANTSLGSGNLSVNGTFDMYIGSSNGKATVVFYGLSNSAVSGTPALLDFNSVTLNKGNTIASSTVIPPILEFQTGFTVQGGNTVGLVGTHTAGTYKIGGSFTLTTPLYSTNGYTVPALGALWLNNATFTSTGQNGTPNLNGLLKISNGIYNVGTASGNSVNLKSGCWVVIEGGALNIAGRFAVDGISNIVNYSQSGGILTVMKVGQSSATYRAFDLGTNASTVMTMSGGAIVIERNYTSGYEYRFTSGTMNISGGTLEIGNSNTPAGLTFRIQGQAPNVIVNSNNNPNVTLDGNLTVFGNLTINGTGTFSLSTSYTLDMRGMDATYPGNITNNGTLTLNAGTTQKLTFSSSFGNQTLTNSGTISGPNQLGNLTINNTFGGAGTVGIPGGLTVLGNTTLTLTKGALNVGSGITLGTGGTTGFTFIKGDGTLSGTTTFAFGTGTVGYTYNGTAAQVTGTELPGTISGTLTINNAAGVTLSAPLSAGFLTLTAGALNTTSTNLITVTTSTATAVSRTSGYVNGPLARALPLTAGTGTWTFPLGTATNYVPFEIVDPTTGATAPVVKVEMTEGTYTGTPGTLLSAVNNDRRWATALVSGNFTSSKIKITDPSVDATKTIASSTSANGTFNGIAASNASTTLTTLSATTLDPYFAVGTKAPMSYVSSTATQTVFTDIVQGATNEQIIGVQVVTTGSDTPLTMDSFTFNTNGSTNGTNNSDIVNAKLYSTGTSPTFATTTQVGSTVVDFTTGAGVFTISPVALSLSEGTNYFWLTYDIQALATNNNIVDAECTSLTVSASAKTPSVTAPAGNRAIFTSTSTDIFTENFEGAWTTPTTLTTGSFGTWSGTSLPAANEWHRNDHQGGWASLSGAYSPTGANSTTYSARFHSWGATNGTTGDFITPNIDFSSYSNTKKLEFYYINTSGTDVLNIYLSTDGGTNWSSSLQQLTTATVWTQYTIVLGTSTATQCKVRFTATSDFGTTDIGVDQVRIYDINAPTMRYFSCTTNQTVTSSVNAGAMNQQVIGIQVVTAGESSPISVSKFTLNANGTTSASDLDSARIYYTGTSSTFAATNQFGSDYLNPTTANFNITGTQQLLNGTNYFWLVYDIDSAAVNNNLVDGECQVVTVGGSDKTPSIAAPVGTRAIVQKTFTSLAVNQASTGVVGTNTSNNPILRLDFVVAGPATGKLLLNTIQVTSTCQNDADIAASGVKLYRTTSTTFATTNPLGTAQSLSGGTATFSSLNYNLPTGTSYVWVTYDIAAGATVDNTVDAKITANAVSVASSTYPATEQDPAGNRIIKAPFSGIVNVGTGGAFTSLTRSDGLFAGINLLGFTGNVIVNITSDLTSEDGSIALNQWNESGAGNYTLTIKPSSATARTISGSYTGGLIRINGADRVTIDGLAGRYLTITNTATSSAKTIEFLAGSTDNSVSRCNISTGSNTSSSNYCIYSNGDGINNLTIDSNNLFTSYYGIYIYGTSTSDNINNAIVDNTIGSDNSSEYITKYGIYAYYQKEFQITGNEIKNMIYNSSPYGISMQYCNAVDIGYNYIHDIVYTGTGGFGGVGIHFRADEGAEVSDPRISIFNNVIRRISGDSDVPAPTSQFIPCGIRIFGASTVTTGINIYYNSIYLSQDLTYGINYENNDWCAGLIVESGPTGINFENNIIYNALGEKTGYTNTSYGYAIYLPQSSTPSSPFGTIDYNVYYVTNFDNIYCGLAGTEQPPVDNYTFAQWQTFTGQEVNSIWADPQYSDNLLHLTYPGSPAVGEAVVLGTITDDYSGKSRHPSYPTIGAHEYAPILNWTGSTSTIWNVQANWTPNIIPDGTYWVVIPNAPTNFPAVPNGVTGNADGITLQGVATLDVQSGGTLNVGTLSFPSTATVNVQGTLNVQGP